MGQSDDGKSKPMFSATGHRVSNGDAPPIKVGITDQSGSEHIIDSVMVEGHNISEDIYSAMKIIKRVVLG